MDLMVIQFTELFLLSVAESAPVNKAGTGKVLEVPIGIETVKQFRKALMFLHSFQFERRSIEWGSPKSNTELKALIKAYQENLLYDHLQTNRDRAAHCVIRDSYKPGQMIKLLKMLWAEGKKTSLRDMFSISARHHMLLRDQDLRNLNFADCFHTIISRKQQAIALVFSMDKGKTLKDGEIRFACAI
jgi:hypothetical protein